MAGTILAFDFGEQRIGVAVGELELRSAHPLQTIDTRDNDTRFAALARLFAEWRPTRVVVGLPAPDRAAHPMNARCRKFARQLEGRFGVAAELVDESYTSAVADADLAAAGLNADRRKVLLDSVAAQAILQTWFERQPARRGSPLLVPGGAAV
jgi:putative Holliday junction resolvase